MKHARLLIMLLSLVFPVLAQDEEAAPAKPKEELSEDVFGDPEEWKVDEFGSDSEFNESEFGNDPEFNDSEFGGDSFTEGAKAKSKKSAKKSQQPKSKQTPKKQKTAEEEFDDEFSDVAQDEPIEEEKPSKAAKTKIKVTALDFKYYAAVSRIVIRANGPLEFDQEADEQKKQVVVILKNVGIVPNLTRRLDTSEFNSPVRLVGAYPVSSPYPAVRIVVQLRQNAPADIRTEGNVLTIDFTNEDYTSSIPNMGQGSEGALQKQTVTLEKDEDFRIGGSFQETISGPDKFYGKPIPSLIVKDEEIQNVLSMIADYSGYNIVTGDEVTGKVTIYLKDVPWDQALSLILKSKGLAYIRTGNVLRVAPIATFQKEKEAAVQALAANVKLEPLRTMLIPVSYGSADDLTSQIKDFISERGSVNVNKRNNTLIIRETEEQLRRILKLVKTLDTESPQVIIEARLIEASKTLSRELGLQWNVNGTNSASFTGGGNAGGDLTVPGSGTGVGGAVQYASTGMSIPFAWKPLNTLALSAKLSLLESDNVLKTITSPRVVTLDNVAANILSGVKQTFPITSPGGPGGSATVQIVELKSETTFKVTPHITAEGSIFLDIDVQRQFTSPNSASSVPDQETRSAKTSVLVENGETAVIGGFYGSKKSLTESGTPWFRHIPLIGFLFRNRTTEDGQSELVFFITPRILNVDKAFVKNTPTAAN